jgi:1-deoxy-D-xylulose 5-phosphate reductoisomerase
MSNSPTAEYLVFNPSHGGYIKATSLEMAQQILSDSLTHPNWKEGAIYQLVQYTKQIETVSFDTWTKD